MRRFFAPEAKPNTNVTLDDGEARHLRDVLRLSVGDAVSVFDGVGGEMAAVVESVDKKAVRLNVGQKTEPASPESHLKLTVASAVMPGDKYDLIIQKMVELGAYRFVPLITQRTEVTLKAASQRLERWRRIAFEASKQCGRAFVMQIAELSLLETVLAEPNVLLFSERDGSELPDEIESRSLTVVFGPKGGWGDEELETAGELGATIVTFGGRILRAETAAIGITAIMQNRFGDMN
ncbi:MAG TPA: RsmE family RNA methyltransferase [Pyrinomonadaceae bacterium]|nr:RsmE family RNA methyltransferase [Pyrinomonadaceae bacterium]